YGRQDECDGHHGGRHFGHGAGGGFAGPHAVIDMALHRFHHHDGVIHHNADGQHQSEHAGDIDGEAQQREQRERADDRYGNGQQRNQRGAPVLQEDEDDEDDEADGFEQRLQHVFNGGPHEHGGVVRDDVADAGGERALDGLHVLRDGVGGL